MDVGVSPEPADSEGAMPGWWLLIPGCAGGSDPASTPTDSETGAPTASTGTSTSDARFDSSTWPQSVTVDGRDVALAFPSDYDGVSTLPVLISLHGYGGNGPLQDRYWGTSDYVDQGGYVLAVPNGTVDPDGLAFWNATDLCCNFHGSDVDDVGFLLGVLDEIEAAFPTDPERVYVAGHSNGGFMSYRLACEAADRITAIASLAGSGFERAASCTPSEPVSILQVHGTLDTVVPYEDGWSPGAETMMARWATRNGCGTPSDGPSQDFDRVLPGSETTVQNWSSCNDDARMALWTIELGSHTPAFDDVWVEELWEWLSNAR